MTNFTSSRFVRCAMLEKRLRAHSPLPGRFQIHDAMDARIDAGDIVRAAGFDEDRVAGIGEHRHERQDIFLQKRFAAGDLDERAIERQRLPSTISPSVRFFPS